MWIHKVYSDILFFFCAINPIEMNFPQNISNSELVCVADFYTSADDHGWHGVQTQLDIKISFYLTGQSVFFHAKILEH